MKPVSFALIALASLFAGSANAVPVLVAAQWNFNSIPADANTATGTILPSTGIGAASLLGGTTATFNSGDASGGSSDPATGDDSGWNLTTFAAQGTGDKTSGAQFAVSTLGLSNIVINYDLRHSSTSARDEVFQYSLDGISFIDFATFQATAGDTWFNGRSVDLSSVAGVANNANFAFRVVAGFAPSTTTYLASKSTSTYGTVGTWRFDMVTVSAMPVPEAETYAMMLAGLGLVGFMVSRRRKFQ